MYRAVVFVVFVVTVSADSDMRKCGRLMHPESMRCCTSSPMKLDGTMANAEDFKECMNLPMKPPSCEREECIAKKKGFYADNGSIDVKSLMALIEKEFMAAPDMFVTLKEKCLDADISKYGPPDACDFIKMRHCIHLNLILKCPEWSDKDDCSDLKGLVEECSKVGQ